MSELQEIIHKLAAAARDPMDCPVDELLKRADDLLNANQSAAGVGDLELPSLNPPYDEREAYLILRHRLDVIRLLRGHVALVEKMVTQGQYRVDAKVIELFERVLPKLKPSDRAADG